MAQRTRYLWRTNPDKVGLREVNELPDRREASQALRALGPVVYAVRVKTGIKIGFTTDLSVRRRHLGSTHSDDLLGFMPGTMADEKAIHARLHDHVEHGREWYYPTPGVMQVVNEMRSVIGLPPIGSTRPHLPSPADEPGIVR